MAAKTRSWWGWGNVEDAVAGEELRQLTGRVAAMLPDADLEAHEAPPVESFGVPASRVRPPAALAALTSDEPEDRLAHSHGRAFRDVVRALLGRLDSRPRPGRAPDRARPRSPRSSTGAATRGSP